MNRPTPSALVVLHAFGRYGRGDMITDLGTIRAILDGGNSALVVVPVLPETSATPATTLEH